MKKINQSAAKVFNTLIRLMDNKQNLKLDNSNEVFMPVFIEKLESDVNIAGRPVDIYSLSHYFEQNGDLVPDPDMTFAVSRIDSMYIWPMTFQTQFSYKRGIFFDDKEGIWRMNESEQADEAVFAGIWLKNIKHQQKL